MSRLDPPEWCIEKWLNESYPPDGTLYCNRTWDGMSCIPDVLAGERLIFQCPPGPAYHDAEKAIRECTINGTWLVNPKFPNRDGFTDYMGCLKTMEANMSLLVNRLYVSGFSVSLFFLVIALVIFMSFRPLKCDRICVHKHLFVSYIMVCIASIVTHLGISGNLVVLRSNPVWCQILHITMQYFTQCNYFWMFAEGFYLHTSLVVAFVSSKTLLIWCYVIGWGFPILVVATYTGLRLNDEATTIMCWVDNGVWQMWIVNIPPTLSVVVNLCLVINIIRILVTKLQAVNTPDTGHIKKTVRATAILIPLLGLHQALILVLPAQDAPNRYIHDVFTAVIISIQGFLVALIYCFLNGEVLSVLKRKWRQKYSYGSSTGLGRTGSVRVCSTENVVKSPEKSGYELTPMHERSSSTKNSDILL